MKKITVLFLLVLLTLPVFAQEADFTLTVLHTSTVIDEHLPNADGIGGTARVATLINEARSASENVLLLDAGDRFIDPTAFGRNADLMNELAYDAMTLGNHEFNGGNAGLLNFLGEVDFPLVAANIDFSAAPLLMDSIPPYVTLERGETTIGIIGLANEEASVLSSPDPSLVFLDDEALVTQEAVDELTAQGVDIIILLAHRDANDNVILGSTVSGVDIIVGGSDNALLSNTAEDADFAYPIETQDADGNTVLVVQTPENNLYFGFLDVSFDADGLITVWSGDTTLLDETIAEDETIAMFIAEEFDTAGESATVVGATDVTLIGGDPCRESECTMGNLITDAIRADTGVDVAIYNSGGIRASINEGDITDQALSLVLPFPNTVATLELRGSDLLAALEHGVSLGGDSDVQGSGRFLQVSGMRFTWNPTAPVGSRVDSVDIMDADGDFAPLQPDTIYSIATNDFMRTGGDEFSVLESNAIDPFDNGALVRDVLTAYIEENSPIAPEIEGRITRVES
ncbi:MAG: 5'-nucleotidase C-terminal domain-containing protein [Chloroflexota bacterium]